MQTAEKNLGGAKQWTTLEQKAWLTGKMPDYVASRSSESKTDFWLPIFEQWFAMWPITFPGTEPAPKAVLAELMDDKKSVSNCVRGRWYDLQILLRSRSKSGTGSRTIVNEPKRRAKVGSAS